MDLHSLGKKIIRFFGEGSEWDHLSDQKEFQSDFLDPDYFSDLLPYRLYDEERKLYENRGSFGFLIEAIPLPGASSEAQRELSSLMQEIGEEKANIQCLAFADYRTQGFLDLWLECRRKKGGIFKEVAEKKANFFKKESLEGEVPPRIFRFFFSYSQPKPLEKDLPFFLDRLSEKKTKALETFGRLTQAFALEPVQLIELVSGLVNFDLTTSIQSRKSWNRDTWLSRQISLPGSAIEIKKEGLVFHGAEKSLFKSYEAVDFPDQWGIAYMGELLGDFLNPSYRIPTPFFIHYGIHFPNQQKTETRYRAKAKVLEHQAKFSSLVRMRPEIPREREENLYVHKKLLDGEKFVETRLSCGLFGDKERHIRSESILLSLFQKYGFKLKENHFVHLPDFLSSLPMAWGEDSSSMRGLKRTRCMRTTLTSETALLMPVVAEWWGNSTRGTILIGRRGQIAAWDPFETGGNLNSIVVGPSGQGKSVFMNEMIMSHLGQGGRVFILDLGRSFEKLCHLLDGQYLEFSKGSQLNLNPFSLVRTDGDIDNLNAALEMVSSIVAMMASPFQKIDNERRDILSTLVKDAWKLKGKEATVDDVVHLIDRMSFRSELMMGATESLKEGLKKFGRDGAFASYFYGTNSIDFTNSLVLIETEELKVMPDLQAVILQIFVLTISNQIFMGSREQRCLICIDEAWDLLKSPQMEGFIESLARRLRKYNGALVVGTQGLDDFETSHGAKAAFRNSNWLTFIGNNSDAINILKKENLIPMNDYKATALSSMRMIPGKYSEVCIYHKGNGSFSVHQLKLDPFSAMLYSTKASEFQAIQELKKEGMRIEEALGWMVMHKAALEQLLSRGEPLKESIKYLLNTTRGTP